MLSVLAGPLEADHRERPEFIALYLSGAHATEEALQRLGGAFAARAGSSGGKDD